MAVSIQRAGGHVRFLHSTAVSLGVTRRVVEEGDGKNYPNSGDTSVAPFLQEALRDPDAVRAH